MYKLQAFCHCCILQINERKNYVYCKNMFSTASPWKWFIDMRLKTFYHQTEYYTIVFHIRFTSLPSLNVTLNIWFYYSIVHPKEYCYVYSLQSHKYNTVISDYNGLYKRKYLDMHQKSVWFLYIYVGSHVWCAQ